MHLTDWYTQTWTPSNAILLISISHVWLSGLTYGDLNYSLLPLIMSHTNAISHTYYLFPLDLYRNVVRYVIVINQWQGTHLQW